MTQLPRLEGFGHLTTLSVSHNQLTALPLTGLTQLQVLDVSNNLIEKLNPQITQLQKLNSLYLQHNRLQSLPCKKYNRRKVVLFFSIYFLLGNLKELKQLRQISTVGNPQLAKRLQFFAYSKKAAEKLLSRVWQIGKTEKQIVTVKKLIYFRALILRVRLTIQC
jgi:Leucine-rich repeat (LRR) protein